MGTDGGLMFHDRGFAGLPSTGHASVPASGEHANIAAGRKNEVSDAVREAFTDSPVGVSSLLLFEQPHACIDGDQAVRPGGEDA